MQVAVYVQELCLHHYHLIIILLALYAHHIMHLVQQCYPDVPPEQLIVSSIPKTLSVRVACEAIKPQPQTLFSSMPHGVTALIYNIPLPQLRATTSVMLSASFSEHKLWINGRLVAGRL